MGQVSLQTLLHSCEAAYSKASMQSEVFSTLSEFYVDDGDLNSSLQSALN